MSFADKLLEPVGGEKSMELEENVNKEVVEEVPKEEDGDHKLDRPIIALSNMELLRWASPWLNTLVVNVMGKHINFYIIG